MTNPDWTDDPDLRVQTMDDADSRRLLKGLRIIFWPWPTLLIILWVAAIIFDIEFLSGPLLFGTVMWIAAHLLFRTQKFLGELRGFGDAIASQLSKLMKALNRASKKTDVRVATPVNVITGDGSGQALPPISDELREAPHRLAAAAQPDEAPRQRTNILAALSNHWGKLLVVAVAVLALIFLDRIVDMFDGPSGREVAAEARAHVEEAKGATNAAETDQARRALERLETAASRYEHLTRQAEQARHAIENAPDLDGGIAEHRAYVDGVRRDAADARASAVHDYRSSVDP